MKILRVTCMPHLNRSSALEAVSSALESAPEHKIDIAPWAMYQYKPAVSFKIGHASDCIFLKYFVTESHTRITYQHPNDPVYRDSCVEFFISVDESGYYNFEFNSVGTCLAAFGGQRENRKSLPAAIIEEIKFSSSICAQNSSGERVISWQLLLILPPELFCYHQIRSLQGLKCMGNFYKCADDMEQQHYLVWNPVGSAAPDFHLKEYFGSIEFI